MYKAKQGIPEPDLLGEAHAGDFQQGRGVSTSQLSRVTVSLDDDERAVAADARMRSGKSAGQNFIDNLTGNSNSGSGASLGTWAVFIVILLLVKWAIESAGEKSEFSTTRIGLENWFIVGGLSMTFAYAFHVGTALINSRAGWANALREFSGAT